MSIKATTKNRLGNGQIRYGVDSATPAKPRRIGRTVKAMLALATLGTTLGAGLLSTSSVAGAAVNPAYGTEGYAYPGDGCTMVLGDQYSPRSYAIGETDITCPTDRTVRIKVYLDFSYYSNGAGATTVAENVAGAAYYTNSLDVWTNALCNMNGYWSTAASISLDGGPYHSWATPYYHFTAGAC